jgi:hypothetical protein
MQKKVLPFLFTSNTPSLLLCSQSCLSRLNSKRNVPSNPTVRKKKQWASGNLELSHFVQRRNDISFLFYEKATKNLERDFTLLSAVGSVGWFFFYESHHIKLYICFNSSVNWWQVLISAESLGVSHRSHYNKELCSQFDDRGIGVRFSTGMEIFFSSTQLSYWLWGTRGVLSNWSWPTFPPW